jgi:hypothetical protein
VDRSSAPAWFQRLAAVPVTLFALVGVLAVIWGFEFRSDPVAPSDISNAMLTLIALGAGSVLATAVVLWAARARRHRFVLVAGAVSIAAYVSWFAWASFADPSDTADGFVTVAIVAAAVSCAGIVRSMLTSGPARRRVEGTA